MQTARHRTWIYAIGGSLAIHAILAGGILLPRSNLRQLLQLGAVFAGQRKEMTLTLGYEKGAAANNAVNSPLTAAEIQDSLAKALNETKNLPQAELATRLQTNRLALNRVPTNHFEDINSTLNQILPALDFTIVPRTNAEGTVEYTLTYTNVSGERQELVFNEEDRQTGGFLNLAEDPRLSPLLRFVLPIADALTTNQAPQKTPVQPPH